MMNRIRKLLSERRAKDSIHLTKPFSETMQERKERDPEFKKELESENDKEVEIPVGGIKDGVVYEKEVRPEGNDPIYKEVRIDDKEDKKG
jgi:hypothetical protein